MSEGNPPRPPKRDRPQPGQGQPPRKASKPKGGIWLQQLRGNDYALSHPRCVEEMEPDYVEGLELWREGDVEAARDALRYALQGCGDNLWVHVALGQIALREDSDPKLARGHFGYAFELAQRAIPPHFDGRLPIDHPSNAPLYDAIDGLIACHEALKSFDLAEEIRALAHRWSTGERGPRG